MSSTTTTTISGNLTRDPEIRYTRDGQATTSLGVAVNRRGSPGVSVGDQE